jgi:hypothetical protein
MRYALRLAFSLLTALEFIGVGAVGDMALITPPAHAPSYDHWGDSHLVNLGGSWDHQCAEILAFGPWFGIESGARTAAHSPESHNYVGESATRRQQSSARGGERRKHRASVGPVGRALEIRLESQSRSIVQPQVTIDFRACGSSAKAGKSPENKRPEG